MLNPVLSELVAHEQCKDRLRQADQRRLVAAVSAGQPTDRYDVRASLDNLLLGVRQLFKVLARAD